MFEVGFTEILLICGLALIVLGPERLPKLASQIGRWVGRARAMARQLRDQLDQEVNFQDEPPAPRAPDPPQPDDYAEHDERSHRDASEDQDVSPAPQESSAEPTAQTPHERRGP